MTTNTNSLDYKSIICVVCVVLGVMIQFLVIPGVPAFIAGTLLIAIPPFFLSPPSLAPPKRPKAPRIGSYQASKPKPSIGQNLDFCDAKANVSKDKDLSKAESTKKQEEKSDTNQPENATRWVTIPEEKVDETFIQATTQKEDPKLYSSFDGMLWSGCLRYFIMIPLLVIGILMGLNEQPHIGAFVTNLALIPWAYARLKYGKDYRKTFESPYSSVTAQKFMTAILFKKTNLLYLYKQTKDLHPDMQFELKKIDGKAYITDVRITFPSPSGIPGILCSMISTALNNSVCPYSYYVLVFKGTQMKTDSIMNKLVDLSLNKHFKGEASVKDDTTVLVVTKYSGTCEYETNEEDCDTLCEIITELNQCIEENKDKITELTMPHT